MLMARLRSRGGLWLRPARSKPNAAPEWQAKSIWGRSRDVMVACPLEGLVGREHPIMLIPRSYLMSLFGWFYKAEANELSVNRFS